MKREKGEGGEFRLKEIVFYNLFLYLFDIIEILIKVTRFQKSFYTLNGLGGWKRSLTKNGTRGMEPFFK